MELQDAVEFIKPSLLQLPAGQVWADLGSGKGLFTRALANILKESTIHAVDRSGDVLEPSVNGNDIVFHQLDFSEDVLPFAELDGILMANSMHFVKDKHRLLSRLRKLLRRDGQLLVIEYEMNRGNHWVPYPIPYSVLERLLKESGFTEIRLIAERPSIYAPKKMYTCAAVNTTSQNNL